MAEIDFSTMLWDGCNSWGIQMKLFIVSANKDVVFRWNEFLKPLEHPIEVVDANQLLLQKINGQGYGLVHISSLGSSLAAPVSTQIKNFLLDQFCAKYPRIKWVAFSDYPGDTEGLSYLGAGFRGYLNTYVTQSLFHEMLNVVMRNDIWAGPSITQLLLKQYLVNSSRQEVAPVEHDSDGYGFTDREEEVLDILITGASNKEIARELGVTERTIKAHVASLLHKTGTKDRLLLVLKLTHQIA